MRLLKVEEQSPLKPMLQKKKYQKKLDHQQELYPDMEQTFSLKFELTIQARSPKS